MKNLVVITALGAAMAAFTSPAFAAITIRVPEPISLTLVAGGVAAIAVVRHIRRK